MHVIDEGAADGPAILLIHGVTHSARAFDQVAGLLAPSHRVVRVDLSGHGRTGGPPLDAPDQAALIDGVLNHLALGEVTVVGHSFGADAAALLAQSREDVTGAIIVGQGPDYRTATFSPVFQLLRIPGVSEFLGRFAPTLVTQQTIRAMFAPGFAPDAELRAAITADAAATEPAMSRIILNTRGARLTANPLDSILRTSGKPSLAILGRHDRLYDCERAAQRYVAAGVEVAVVENSGHSPHMEAPAEVAEVIARFIRG